MIYPIRFGIAQTVYFPLITAGGTAFQDTWTPAAAECRYIGDGAGITNLGSVCAHEDAGIWSQALTATESSFGATVLKYADAETDIEAQAIICLTIFSGQIEANQAIIIGEVDTPATFTATTIAFEGFRLSPNVTEEATSSHYLNRNLLFTSGALLGQQTRITSYVLANSKEKFGYDALTEAPADGDRYVVI